MSTEIMKSGYRSLSKNRPLRADDYFALKRDSALNKEDMSYMGTTISCVWENSESPTESIPVTTTQRNIWKLWATAFFTDIYTTLKWHQKLRRSLPLIWLGLTVAYAILIQHILGISRRIGTTASRLYTCGLAKSSKSMLYAYRTVNAWFKVEKLRGKDHFADLEAAYHRTFGVEYK